MSLSFLSVIGSVSQDPLFRILIFGTLSAYGSQDYRYGQLSNPVLASNVSDDLRNLSCRVRIDLGLSPLHFQS